MSRDPLQPGNLKTPGIIVAIAVLLLIATLLVCVRPQPSPVEPTPLPYATATPTPGPDSGFHEAIFPTGTDTVIQKRYDDMSDSERDASNAYAHQYPDGH